MHAANLALAGLGIGAVAALAGLGVLVTYRATGVFNLAFGAIAMVAAYLQWQMVTRWHWPVGLAAIVVLLGFCPALGWLLETMVFRPLQRRGAMPAELLVASIGVLVLLVGGAYVAWGGQARLNPPSLVPERVIRLFGETTIRLDTLVQLGAVGKISEGVTPEQGAAAAENLRRQAGELLQAVAIFRLGGSEASPAARAPYNPAEAESRAIGRATSVVRPVFGRRNAPAPAGIVSGRLDMAPARAVAS